MPTEGCNSTLSFLWGQIPPVSCHSTRIQADNASGTGRAKLQPISHIPSKYTPQPRSHFCGAGCRVRPDLRDGRDARPSSSSPRPDPFSVPPLPPIPPTALSALALHGYQNFGVFDARNSGAHLADDFVAKAKPLMQHDASWAWNGSGAGFSDLGGPRHGEVSAAPGGPGPHGSTYREVCLPLERLRGDGRASPIRLPVRLGVT